MGNGVLPWQQYASVNALFRELQADVFSLIMSGRAGSEKRWLWELTTEIRLLTWGKGAAKANFGGTGREEFGCSRFWVPVSPQYRNCSTTNERKYGTGG